MAFLKLVWFLKLYTRFISLVCVMESNYQPTYMDQKLIVVQLVKKFPAFYGTQRIIAVFTTARHCSLS